MRITQPAQWIFKRSTGTSGRNAEAVQISKQYRALRAQVAKLEVSAVGALFLEVFATYTTLNSYSLRMKAESVTDDVGGYHRSLNMTVGDIVLTAQSEGDEPDQSEIGYAIEEKLESDLDLIYDVFEGKHSYNDLHLQLSRASVAELLQREEVSGQEAFVALFPKDQQLAD